MTQTAALAPGVLIRDAEWPILSELVRNREATFLIKIEPQVEVLDPALTRLIPDESPNYWASLLYMESLLRHAAPTDDWLYVGHRAMMDSVPYQFEPALQALEQPASPSPVTRSSARLSGYGPHQHDQVHDREGERCHHDLQAHQQLRRGRLRP